MRPLPNLPPPPATKERCSSFNNKSSQQLPSIKTTNWGKSREVPLLPAIQNQFSSFLGELTLGLPVLGAVGNSRESELLLLWTCKRVILMAIQARGGRGRSDLEKVSLICLWDLEQVVYASIISRQKIVVVTQNASIKLLSSGVGDEATAIEELHQNVNSLFPAMPRACFAIEGSSSEEEEAFVLVFSNGSRIFSLSTAKGEKEEQIWISEFEAKYAFWLGGGGSVILLDWQGNALGVRLKGEGGEKKGEFVMRKAKLFNGARVCSVVQRKEGELGNECVILCDDGWIWKMNASSMIDGEDSRGCDSTIMATSDKESLIQSIESSISSDDLRSLNARINNFLGVDEANLRSGDGANLKSSDGANLSRGDSHSIDQMLIMNDSHSNNQMLIRNDSHSNNQIRNDSHSNNQIRNDSHSNDQTRNDSLSIDDQKTLRNNSFPIDQTQCIDLMSKQQHFHSSHSLDSLAKDLGGVFTLRSNHQKAKITCSATKIIQTGIFNGKFLCISSKGEDFFWIWERSLARLIDLKRQEITKEFRFGKKTLQCLVQCQNVMISLFSDCSLQILDAEATEVRSSNLELLPRVGELNFCLCTWNAGNCSPPQFPPLPVQEFQKANLIAFGLQEIIDINSASSILNATAVKEKASNWTEVLLQKLPEFSLVGVEQLFGILLVLLQRKEKRAEKKEMQIKNLEFSTFKTGMNGYHGNKGAVGCRFQVSQTWISLVVAHLAAGEGNVQERNIHANSILRELKFSPSPDSLPMMWGCMGERIMEHHCAFFMGDLNYRCSKLAVNSPPHSLESEDDDEFKGSRLKDDELLRACRTNPHLLLGYWKEMPIEFGPTYKYKPGTRELEFNESGAKQRQPSWTDRIMYLVGNSEWLKLEIYGSTAREMCTPSDHKAVFLRGRLEIR